VQRFVALGGGGDLVDVHHALEPVLGEITKRNDDLMGLNWEFMVF
jgi:hypothetical protein